MSLFCVLIANLSEGFSMETVGRVNRAAVIFLLVSMDDKFMKKFCTDLVTRLISQSQIRQYAGLLR